MQCCASSGMTADVLDDSFKLLDAFCHNSQCVHEHLGRQSDQLFQYSHMLSRVCLMCRPKAVPPWAASTGQCSSCHCCSACDARARLGQYHTGECGTGPAAHQAAWQVAGMPHVSIDCCRTHSNGFLHACISQLCWRAGACSRQTAE